MNKTTERVIKHLKIEGHVISPKTEEHLKLLIEEGLKYAYACGKIAAYDLAIENLLNLKNKLNE